LKRAALHALCYAIAAFFAAVSIADIYYHCRWDIFFPDEIYNLDPILTFFRTGDYTSKSQGNHPFDPVLSSGILATWLNGLVYVVGGNLYRERLASALVQFAIATYFAFRLLRSRGVARVHALVIALGTWTTLIVVGCHYLRIINTGEIWGFIYLAAGFFFVERSPPLAAFVWGLGTWLAKIIYLPYSGLLVVALALGRALESSRETAGALPLRLLANVTRLGLAFVAPVFLWMALIVVRYDFATLGHWMFSYVTFVAKHGADVQVAELPVYEGWRFSPDWHAMPLFRDWRDGVSYVGPIIAAGVALVVYVALRLAGLVRSTLRDALLLAAVCVALTAAVTWFFTLDPTNWGRHLMPAIYVAIAVLLYCGAEIYRSVRTVRFAQVAVGLVAYSAVLAGGYYAYAATRTYADAVGWKPAYSPTCRGTEVLAPPCLNNDTLNLIDELGKEWCGPATQMFSPNDYCKSSNRRRIVAHAVDVLADADAHERLVSTNAYLLTLIVFYDYEWRREFLADLGPLICRRPKEPLSRRLNALGLDDATLAEACLPPPGDSQPQATPQ